VAVALCGPVACGRAGSSPATTGGGAGTGTPSATSGTSSPVAPATGSSATSPSASGTTEAARLGAFFAAAGRADAQLRTAADRINAAISPTTIVIDAATVAAVKAVDVEAVARAVPAGLPSTLTQQVLEVYADLSSRQAAFQRVLEDASQSPLPRNSDVGKDLIRCLGNGSAPARFFAGDLAAVRSTASGMPALTPAAPTSRAAAELALRLHAISLPNNCAEECGGYAPRPIPLYQFVWGKVHLAPGSDWDGHYGDTGLFTARYVTGQGWQIAVNAC
jgi:hypothetical protein